jgi:hypothetical protein
VVHGLDRRGRVAGGLTNNNAAPGATNVGTLGARATAAAPSYTEGNQVTLSTDLSGRLRADVTTVGGTATATNTGTSSAGTQRVVLATDQPTNTNAWKVKGNDIDGATANGGVFIVGGTDGGVTSRYLHVENDGSASVTLVNHKVDQPVRYSTTTFRTLGTRAHRRTSPPSN